MRYVRSSTVRRRSRRELTVVDDAVSCAMQPRPSLPPKPYEYEWTDRLAESDDGRWHLVAEFTSSGAARTTVWKERKRRPANWEFRHGPSNGRYGVWARNLEGPRFGEDEDA